MAAHRWGEDGSRGWLSTVLRQQGGRHITLFVPNLALNAVSNKGGGFSGGKRAAEWWWLGEELQYSNKRKGKNEWQDFLLSKMHRLRGCLCWQRAVCPWGARGCVETELFLGSPYWPSGEVNAGEILLSALLDREAPLHCAAWNCGMGSCGLNSRDRPCKPCMCCRSGCGVFGVFFSVISKDLRSIHVQFWLILNTLSTGSLSCDKPVVWGKSNGHSGEAAALSLWSKSSPATPKTSLSGALQAVGSSGLA